ncbi:hypothetical protein [Sphingomonas sp. Leaf4]|uniref:hypothetical protein n=1 Tax=Sphingomonas sp. Leaf4 TaxID=2876553 RepID=UPI001E38485F|nr:hypothetical protein [Sphingomonas sp. Leaf4]
MIDTIILGIALIALLIARQGVAVAAARSAVAARLRALYTLTAMLAGLRLLTPVVPATPVVVALMTVAAWLPFAALRLVEELCRRHARRSVKLLALGGGLGFSVLAVTLGVVWSAAALLALAGFQAMMLVLMIAQMARARRDLRLAERRTLDSFLLALALTIPLALTDFTALLPDAPVRGGAIAALVMVLGSSRLADDRGTPLGLVADLAVAIGAGGVLVAIGRVVLPDVDLPTGLRLTAAGGALAALLLLIERTRDLAGQESGLTAALARVDADDMGAILSAHPLLDHARIIEGDALAAYPPASVARLLDHRVVRGDLADAETRDAACDLLLATQATHLIRLSRDPPRLLAVAAGGLAGRSLDDEIALAARLIERAA